MDEMTLGLEKKKYRCTKGHEWEGSFLANGYFKISFSMPNGQQREIPDLCLICLLDLAETLLKDIGRVKEVTTEARAIKEPSSFK